MGGFDGHGLEVEEVLFERLDLGQGLGFEHILRD